MTTTSSFHSLIGGTSGGGIEEAPITGFLYGRKDGNWSLVPDPGIADAPDDGTIYARQNNEWVEVPEGTGGGGPVVIPALLYERSLILTIVEPPLELELLFKGRFTSNFTLRANMSGCLGSFSSAPVTPMTFSVKKNGTEVGTILVPISGSFTFATTGGAAVTFVKNVDEMTIWAPGTADSSINSLSFTILGDIS